MIKKPKDPGWLYSARGSSKSPIVSTSGHALVPMGFYYRTQFDGSANFIVCPNNAISGTVTVACTNGQTMSANFTTSMAYEVFTFTGLNAGTNYGYTVSGALSLNTIYRIYIGANNMPTWS